MPPAPRAYLLSALLVAAVAALSFLLLDRLELANIVMLFPLVVLFAAVRLGRGPAVLAALLSVGLFDFLLVPPHFTLAISDLQYLITLAVLLVVALTTAELATGLRRQRDVAQQREQRARALYEMARELSAALTVERIDELGRRFASDCLAGEATLLLPDAAGRLSRPGGLPTRTGDEEFAAAARVFEGAHHRVATLCLPGGARVVPLCVPPAVRGVMLVRPIDPRPLPDDWQQTLETFATLVAISVERIHYVEVARAVELDIAAERLRNSLLAALSHDLRTPLTAMLGLAESLPLAGPLLTAQQEIADAIRDEALRTSSLVNNLLEMARLQSGGIRLRCEWQPLEEVVGAALRARAQMLARHRLHLELPAAPLLCIDAVLMEQVFCNLIENAAKFSPPGACIGISARTHQGRMLVQFCDEGPGFAAEQLAQPFGRFGRRGGATGAAHGGLGLAIVQAIVEAHQGKASATNRPDGGACITLSLPLGTPPDVEPEVA